MTSRILLCLRTAIGILAMITSPALAQKSRSASSEILLAVQKLNVLGNVLYFGAHPDDENTTFIAYMANEKHYNTAYFSLTRGDGGQNALGQETQEALGIIRTQELLRAREIDGGQQFFGSAIDFGFSKNAEEVFTIWDKERLLADAVWVIRKFRPDVIVTRFPPDERAGHGHHIASAIIAEEAFDAAADPSRFPDQLRYVRPWQARRLVWNAGMWWNQRRDGVNEEDARASVKLDIGGYNCLMGKSYGEIAAESRSQHRSQGFGTAGFRGALTEYFKPVKGEKATSDLFSGIDTGWTRVRGSGRLGLLIARLSQTVNPFRPADMVPALLAIRAEMLKLPDGNWKTTKLKETEALIIEVLGLSAQATSARPAYTPGELLATSLALINRSSVPVAVKSIHWPFQPADSIATINLTDNQTVELKNTVRIPDTAAYTQPYWLAGRSTKGNFHIPAPMRVGLPENPPAAAVDIRLLIDGQTLACRIPVVFSKTDPILGQNFQPLAITPPVFVQLDQKVYLCNGAESRKVCVHVSGARAGVSGRLRLNLPPGWKALPASFEVQIKEKEGDQSFTFELVPPGFPDNARLSAEFVLNGKVYDQSLQLISYSHIPEQRNFPLASAKVVRTDIQKSGNLIGYLQGSGDLVPASLQEMGYQVQQLKETDFTLENLARLDAVVIGVRAYNLVQRMKVINPVLLQYVEQGGNLIVQYNADQSLLMEDIGPYPFKISARRVSMENSAVRFVDSACQVLNHPNKITQKDFDGWVQERSLYQPEQWSEKYQTVIACNDPGEKELQSGILIAKYGKGNYIYTTLSWFRQLPAGVPGAYRLFANLVSLDR